MLRKMLNRAVLEGTLEDQAHLLRFWDELSVEEKEAFTRQIQQIDIKKCRDAFTTSAGLKCPDLEKITPIPQTRHIISSSLSNDTRERFFKTGLKAISEGKLCILVLAGGQASRLGSSMPKGVMPLGLCFENSTVNVANGDSLLSIQAAKIYCLQELAKKEFPGTTGKIHWAVMTSTGTFAETKAHLEKIVPANGLSMKDVTIFSQGNMPAFDMDGNLLLAKKGEISTAPNGNGGLFSALSNYLPLLRKLGIKYVQTYCVDNILCRVGDPVMLGMLIEKDCDCAAKTVERWPGESVGSIAFEDGKPRVVEYSELGNLEALRDPTGKLLYRAGNIAIHFFDMNFLESFCNPDFILPYHRAIKKIPYVDQSGKNVKPNQPNGIKLEQFIFDVFSLSRNFYIWEVSREDEFSPLKNPESVGVDCLSTCIRDLAAQSKRWLQAVGCEFDDAQQIFISAIRSYAGEGLDDLKGTRVQGPVIQ